MKNAAPRRLGTAFFVEYSFGSGCCRGPTRQHLLNTKFMEEDFVSHIRITKHFIPTKHFDIKI